METKKKTTAETPFATDTEGKPWRLIDRDGYIAGLATWENVRDSLEASHEGWIPGPVTLDVFVDGNVDELGARLAEYDAGGSDDGPGE
jgi:hypothetical protein